MKPFRSMRLKQETSTNLDDALAASAAGDLSVGAAAYSSGRGAKVYQVEDVGYLAAKLEPHALIYGEIAEKRGIDVLVARHVELCGTLVAKHARRTEACTTGIDAGSAHEKNRFCVRWYSARRRRGERRSKLVFSRSDQPLEEETCEGCLRSKLKDYGPSSVPLRI